MKILTRSISVLIIVIFSLIAYLSLIGIETKRLNDQIVKKIKLIDENLNIELNEIKIILNPINFDFSLKTVGPKLTKNKIAIEIESIKSKVLLKSLINNKFAIQNLEISTKSVEINDLISFVRSFKNTPELFILEKIIKKGYLIADIKLEFDDKGEVKDEYYIKGFIKDTKLKLSKKYNFEKLNFIFNYKNNNLRLEDIKFSINELVLFSKKIVVQNKKNNLFIEGSIDHDEFDLNKENLKNFIKPFFPKIDIEKIKFSSKNVFSFKLNKKREIKNLEIDSKLMINEFLVINNLNLNSFFPKSKKNISLSKNQLNIKYKNDQLLINGNGNILLQNSEDFITYNIKKKNEILNFKTSLNIKDNPLLINFLNYEKNENTETLIVLEGTKDNKSRNIIKSFLLKENKNKIEIKNMIIDNQFKIIDIEKAHLDYIDKEREKNLIKLYKKKNEFFLEGLNFNASSLLEQLLSNDNSSSVLNLEKKLNIKIENVRLDKQHHLKNFSGFLFFKNQKPIKANITGDFPDNKKFKFTINKNGNNKITTLFMDEAEPIIRHYKFIKGFKDGSLDFYSSDDGNQATSTLKIYNFKLMELPALTKILTLASLQGIADILSGEGIRFDEFEMSFKNKKDLITIDEVYAIGPALSILMDGYVEKNKLVSLRGTLVPATTINKVISSIPVLGKILVGSKTGEGVFGVSFKIKGPQSNTETTVNPIKTLTPRFITRTLEKLKKKEN